MPLTRQQLEPFATRIDKLYDDLSELSEQVDEEQGEDSKPAYLLADTLYLLRQAYETLVFGKF